MGVQGRKQTVAAEVRNGSEISSFCIKYVFVYRSLTRRMLMWRRSRAEGVVTGWRDR